MPQKQEVQLPEKEARLLLATPAYNEVLGLCGNDIILDNNVEQIRALIAELKVFAPISNEFKKSFGKLERKKGELFVPVRHGWPQPNLVVNPHEPSVIQINKVVVDGAEKSFGSLLKQQFPDEDFDGYDLHNASEDAELKLIPTLVIPTLSIIKDARGKAIAVIRRLRAD